MAIKLTEVVSKFTGDDGDIEKWLDRLDTAFRVAYSDADDEERRRRTVSMMPLFLDGKAYATWKQLTDTQKSDMEAVCGALRRTFGKTKLQAWAELKSIKFFPGDSVDVMADEIATLWRTISDGQEVHESVVGLTLLDALPDRISSIIRLHEGEKVQLKNILLSAKSLLAGSGNMVGQCAVANTKAQVKGNAVSFNHPKNVTNTHNIKRCFVCNATTHLQNNCPDKAREITCFKCGLTGHVARKCTNVFAPYQQGNANAREAAQALASLALTD